MKVEAGKFFPGEHFELRLNETDWEAVTPTYHITPEQQAVGRVTNRRGTFVMKQECAVAYCARHRLINENKEGQDGR